MERKEGMKKNREMFSGLMAWLVSACFFLGCFGNQQLLEKISKLGNSHILIYGLTLILFCLVFLAAMGVTGRMQEKQSCSDGKQQGRSFCFLCCSFARFLFGSSVWKTRWSRSDR